MTKKDRPYKSRFGLALRTVALTLVVSFLVSDISHAAPGLNFSLFSGDLAANPSLLKFPLQTAKISEIYRAPQKEKQKLLIHIQDAHTNFSAQENISKVLEDLASRYKVKTIFVEGGTGDDSLSFIRPLAPKTTRERVAKKYLLAGEIKGVEYLDLVSDHTLTVWGVEDKTLYDKNLKAYAAIAAGREAALGYLSEIERRVCMLKEKLFSKELKAFDDCADAFEKKEKDFSEYHAALSTAAKKAGVNLFGYPNFVSLENLKAAEENIDFKRANEEQAELLSLVFHNAAEREEALALLSGEVSKLKSTSVSPAFIYEALLERAKSAGLNPSSYENLAKYTDYLKTFANVDPQKLFEETKNLKAQIYREALGKDDDAMYLHEISEYLSHLKALYSLQISKEDFETYMAYRKDVRFETIVLLAFLNKHLYDLGRAGDVQRFLQLIDDNRKAVEDFYHTNESRDQSFVDKALKAMDKDNISTAVLIAGGYHTSNLKELLKSRGVSYAVVTPQISQETNIKRYEQILLGQLGDENPLAKKTVTAKDSSAFVEGMAMDTVRLATNSPAPRIIVDINPTAGRFLPEFRSDPRALVQKTLAAARMADEVVYPKNGAKKQINTVFLNTASGRERAAFSGDGKMFASASMNGIELWNATTGEQIRFFEDRDMARFGFDFIVFDADGKTISAGTKNGAVKRWNLETGMGENVLREGLFGPVYFSDDGKMHASQHQDDIFVSTEDLDCTSL